MTSWIVAIDKHYPQHWAIAVRHGFWDMTRHKAIAAGDDVYFWQAGASLVGHTRATTAARELQPGDRPWEDSGVRHYTWRFDFRLLSDRPEKQPRWAEVSASTGIIQSLQSGIVSSSSAAAGQWLRAQFAYRHRLDISIPEHLRVEVGHLLGEDVRDRAVREIALRRGQPAFRKALLDAYGSTCAVTRSRVPEVLEAAHISPYLGTQTNVVTNGLLLRADVHTLFDLFLVTVTPGLVVKVSPRLADTDYAALDNSALHGPLDRANAPSRYALSAHNANCDWPAVTRDR
jgi:hypothetical protein